MEKGFGGSHKNPKRICERSPHACMHSSSICSSSRPRDVWDAICKLPFCHTYWWPIALLRWYKCLSRSHIQALCPTSTVVMLLQHLSLSLTHPHTHIHKGVQASKQALWGGHYSLLVLAISYDEAQFNTVFVEGLLATVLCIALLVWLDDPASRLIFLQSSSNALISSPTTSSSSHRYSFFFAPLDFDTVCDHVWKLMCHWWWGFGSQQLLMELIGIMNSSSKPSLPTGLKDEQLPHHPWHPNSHQQQAVVTNCCSWDIFFLLLLVLVLLLWNSVFLYQGIDLFTGS